MTKRLLISSPFGGLKSFIPGKSVAKEEEELVELAVRRRMLHFAQCYAGALLGILLIILSFMQMRLYVGKAPWENPVAPWCILPFAVPLTLLLYFPGILSASTLNCSYLYVFLLAACCAALPAATKDAPSSRFATWGQLSSAFFRIPASTFAPRLSMVLTCNLVPAILVLALQHEMPPMALPGRRTNTIMFELACFTFAVCIWVACQRALTSKAKQDLHCGKMVSESRLSRSFQGLLGTQRVFAFLLINSMVSLGFPCVSLGFCGAFLVCEELHAAKSLLQLICDAVVELDEDLCPLTARDPRSLATPGPPAQVVGDSSTAYGT